MRGCSFAGRAGGSLAGFDPSRFVSWWCEGELLGKGVGDVSWRYVETEVGSQEVVVNGELDCKIPGDLV